MSTQDEELVGLVRAQHEEIMRAVRRAERLVASAGREKANAITSRRSQRMSREKRLSRYRYWSDEQARRLEIKLDLVSQALWLQGQFRALLGSPDHEDQEDGGDINGCHDNDIPYCEQDVDHMAERGRESEEWWWNFEVECWERQQDDIQAEDDE